MIRDLIYRKLSTLHQWRAAYLAATLRDIRYNNPTKRVCNICGFVGELHPLGRPIRPEAQCPKCFSLERHRTFKLWFDVNVERFRDANCLHFAPETSVRRFVEGAVSSYKTADLNSTNCDLILNIEKIALPDGDIDIAICSHILEHVDDRAALSELYRIIKPGGFAILMCPVIEGWAKSYEDSSVESGTERDLYFGQNDHRRYYGADVRSRITDAKFILEEFTAVEPFVARHGLIRGEKVFIANRP